jgi:hypothetical protein
MAYRLILMAKRLNTRTPHRQAIRVRITGPIRIGVVGSPAYFAGRRPPRTPDDPASHNCVQYRLGAKGPIGKWRFERNGKARQIAGAGRLTCEQHRAGPSRPSALRIFPRSWLRRLSARAN